MPNQFFNSALLLSFILPVGMASAATVSNHLIGVGVNTSKQEVYLCYNSVNDPYNYDSGNIGPNGSFDLPVSHFTNFNVRLSGCDPSKDTYIGNFTVSANGFGQASLQHYSHPKMAKLNNLTIKKGVITGKTVYIPPSQTKLTDPTHKIDNKSPWPYVGVNLSGNEFGKFWNPINSPTASEIEPFVQAGMNTIRLPIRWAYLQPYGAGIGNLDTDYLTFIKTFLENATKYKINVIVDLHNYMRYSDAGVGVDGVPAGGSLPDGKLVTSAAPMVDAWTKLVAALQADKNINQNYVIYDLSNEPDNMSSIGGTETALKYQNAIIAAIRKQGAKNLVLVEGNHWTGLHSWTSQGGDGTKANSEVFVNSKQPNVGIKDPDNNFAINVHQYFDSNYSGTQNNCIANLSSINMQQFVDYLKKNHLKAIVTEFGTGRGNNCMQDLNQFLTALKQNAYTSQKGYGFIGWTAWSAGHAWGGYPGYTLYIDKNAPQMNVFKNFLN